MNKNLRCTKCGEQPETIQIVNRFEIRCSTPCERVVSHSQEMVEKVWNEMMGNEIKDKEASK
jgi:hypothetical protein